MKRPVQRLIIIVIALVLVVPIGALGLNQMMGSRNQEQDPSTAEQEPTPDDRPTVDPAEQPPRPEIERPEEPAAMAEQTSEGAQATLTYLLESYTYMMTTGDTSVWSESVDPNCQVCTSFLDNAELLGDQGGYLVDGEFAVEGTSFEGSGEPPASGTVTAQFTQEASTLVDDPTRVAYELEEVSGQLHADMAWDGERWRVSDMGIAPDGAGASDGGGGEVPDGGAVPGG